MTRVFITGTAGFIGFHLARLLLDEGFTVHGYDGMTDYYDVTLKQRRHQVLHQKPGFAATEALLEDEATMNRVVDDFAPDIIIHLAAQAGVRYSLEEPRDYVQANVVGTFNVMEAARRNKVQHLLMASTSSVYGANTRMPYAETDKADSQLTIYAATKKATEAMAHSYAHLYGIPVTMFRFFTVYGPWGRPDMALFMFTKNILEGRPIKIFNHGRHKRDFTYVDDIVEGVVRCLDKVAEPCPDWSGDEPDSATSFAPFRVFNIGNGKPVALGRFIEVLEDCLGKKAERELLPMQPGDVQATFADVSDLEAAVGFRPETPLSEGLSRFVGWYRQFYQV